MRKIIAALAISVDGYIEGPNGELDWVDTWEDPFDLTPQIDACILGGGMYPGYERYWGAIIANPKAALPFTGKVPTKGEVAYAAFAAKTPHYVVSRTLREVGWKNAHLIRDLEDVRKLKRKAGRDMHAVGGASLVSSLVNEGLVDEIRIVVHPVLLGGGKSLFKDVKERHSLKLVEARLLASGLPRLIYKT